MTHSASVAEQLRKQHLGTAEDYERAVTHLDVSQSQIHQAMDALNTLVN